ncbi:MAG TPA: tetratricopeptide repeat protein [Streptosporangiaceae bacterium]|nr:tetratricopeptide repeat protein [Streptosporangiaceae bacterium]
MEERAAPDFASLLRLLRNESGLTQEELARAAMLSPRTVSDLERGIHRSAQKDTAGLLADALGLTGPARGLFVAAARGRVPVAQVLAVRADTQAAHVVTGTGSGPVRPVPRELPADVDSFTGRAVELAELDLLLPTTARPDIGAMPGPVVISAVSGTAGVGKTALAVRWAHRAASAFPDGQLYVNLRGYDPDQPVAPAEALAGFLRALGVAGQDIPLDEAERAARYRSVVAGKQLLVVLDNVATVAQVRPLLPGSGSVMVLVTSRDALAGLVARDGAHRLDLDLLPGDDAVALLRALIGGRAEAEPSAAHTLAGLCARLPLALRVAAELAAARPDTPLAELVAELAEEAGPLARLDAGGDPRAAVASVFSWSYRHLPDDAARMFRLLGMHPGADWDRFAAAALAGTGAAQAGRLLGQLASTHLIQASEAGRYGMHDLLRAYAAGLAAHDTDQARQEALTGLFDYYLAACAAAMDHLHPAERHHRPEPPQTNVPIPSLADAPAARAWLDAELPTLVAIAAHGAEHGWPGHAIRLAATLHRYLHSGHDIEGLVICTHALKAARDRGDQAAQASALASLGAFHGRQGRYEEATRCHREALALARAAGDKLAQARALGNLALVHDEQGRYPQSARCQSQALALYRDLDDVTGQAISLSNLGLVYLRQGRYKHAVERIEQALARYREVGHRFGEAIALTNLGAVCYRQGNYQQAADLQVQAMGLARELGDRRVAAWALTRLGEARYRQGRHAEAAAHHQQALEGFREIGDREGEADALNGAGETLLAASQPEAARSRHTAALTLTRQTGNQRAEARAICRLGGICQQQDQQTDAAGHYEQALALYRKIGDWGGETDALNSFAETQLATGQPEQARSSFTAALGLARRTGARYEQARAHLGLAGAYDATGHYDLAGRHRRQAMETCAGLGVPEARQPVADRE